MRFIIRIPINKPPVEVARLMRATHIMKDWESNFSGYAPVKGAKRRMGSIGTRIYKEPDGKVTRMREEVTAVDKDGRFTYVLTHEQFTSHVECRFLDQGEASTILVEDTQVKFRPAALNIIGFFIKNNMKKRRKVDLEKFRDIVEGNQTK
jgi:hypothetical protein